MPGGASGRMGMGMGGSMEMNAGNVAMAGASVPAVCYLHITAEIVELETYRHVHPGEHLYNIPAEVVESEGVAATAVEARAGGGGAVFGNNQLEAIETEEEYVVAEAKQALDVTDLLRETRAKREQVQAEERVSQVEREQQRLDKQGGVGKEEQHDLVKGVISSLLRDIVGSEDVRDSCMALPEEAETPFFYNFRQVSPDAEEEGRRLAREALLAETAAAEKAGREAKRKALLHDSESQEIMSKVMENTIFNLLQDASHGEFNLFVKPKRFMVVGE